MPATRSYSGVHESATAVCRARPTGGIVGSGQLATRPTEGAAGVTAKPDPSNEGVVRSLGDSALAGGPIAVAIAAGAFLIARLARLLRRG